jgi:Xaa-Pro aminopeptidase
MMYDVDLADAPSQCLRLPGTCAEGKADALLVTALDEIAWLFNLRGSDVSYNPVFLSYAIITKDGATLYVDSQKVWLLDSQGFLACFLCHLLVVDLRRMMRTMTDINEPFYARRC